MAKEIRRLFAGSVGRPFVRDSMKAKFRRQSNENLEVLKEVDIEKLVYRS